MNGQDFLLIFSTLLSDTERQNIALMKKKKNQTVTRSQVRRISPIKQIYVRRRTFVR